MPVRQKIFLLAIYLFIIFLFFPSWQALNFFSTVFLVITAFYQNSFKQKLAVLRERKFIYGILLFFIYIFISVLTSDNRANAFQSLDPRLPLLYFPLSIGLVNTDKAVSRKALTGIAVIITIVSLVCVINGIYRAAHFHNTSYLYNDALSESVTGLQSIYVSLLVNISIFIFTWLYISRPQTPGRSLFIPAIIFLFITSFLLASRNLMLGLYAATLIFAFYHIIKKRKYLEGATLIFGLLISLFITVKFFPKTMNRFKELSYTSFNFQQDGAESHYDMSVDSTQWNGANTRRAIWQCGWELFRQYPVFGVHLGDKKDKLTAIYREKKFDFALRTQKNLHNNYLDILVGLGIMGFILFISSWIILPLFYFRKKNDILSLSILLTFVMAMVTENYFDRSLGGMLFGFFVTFLLSSDISKNEPK